MLGWLLVALPLFVAPQAKSAPAGQTITANSLVDAEYAFELSAPSPEWSLIGEREIGELHAAALAGMSNGSGLRSYLMLRRVPKTTLEECQNWLMDQVPIADRTVTKREIGTFAGQKALVAMGLGDLHGARMRFRLAAFLSKGYAYLLLGYGPMKSVGAETKELQPLFDAFKLASTTPKGRAFAPSEDSSAGAGWTLAGGTYTHPQLGLRIAAPPSWRTLTHGNAALGDNLVGFASREPEVLVMLGAEIVDSSIQKQWQDTAASLFDSSLDPSTVATLKPQTLPFAGATLQARWYRHRTDPLHNFLVGSGTKDGMCYRVAVRALLGEEDKALREAKPVLAAAQPLVPLRRAQAALEMFARGEDSQSRIGSRGFLRAGRYKDTESGFLVDLPPGFWTTDLASTFELMDVPVRLEFRDEVRGLEGLIYVYPFAAAEITVGGGAKPEKRKRTARYYSERVIDALIGDEPDEDDEITEKRSLNTKETPVAAGPWTMYSMSATWLDKGFKKRIVTVGHLRNSTLAILVLRGLEPAVKDATPSLRRAAATFRWLSGSQGTRYVKDGRFHDDRLGVSLPLGAGDWSWVPDSNEEAIEGYLCEIKGPTQEILLFEVQSGIEMPTASALARRFKRRLGEGFGKVDWDKPVERDAVMGGAPARVFDFAGATGRIEISIVRANGLQYGVGFVRRGTAAATPGEFDAFKKDFAFTTPGGQAAEITASETAAAAEAEKDEPSAGDEPAGGDAGAKPGDAAGAKPPTAGDAKSGDKPAGAGADAKNTGAAKPDQAELDAKAHALLLPTGWRELPIREPIAGFDLQIAFRAEPSWLEQLQSTKTVELRGADARPLLAAVHVSGTSDGACDVLAVERFALNTKTADAAAVEKAAAALVAKAGGRDYATRTIAEGRVGPVLVLGWREPPPKVEKSAKDPKAPKPKKSDAAGGAGGSGAGDGASGGGASDTGTEGGAAAADDGSRHTRVYLITSGMRGWSVTVRTRQALGDAESEQLDAAVAAYEPPQ
jgi:hypothetical protein